MKFLVLTSNMIEIFYINKLIYYLQELNSITEEKLSRNLSAYLFLRNIQDADYKSTLKFFKNTGCYKLHDFVNKIMKTERILLQKN